MQKTLPFDEQFIRRLTDTWPTPFYVYDEAGIRRTCRELNAAFAWSPGFREYFAVKPLPNPGLCGLRARRVWGRTVPVCRS